MLFGVIVIFFVLVPTRELILTIKAVKLTNHHFHIYNKILQQTQLMA